MQANEFKKEITGLKYFLLIIVLYSWPIFFITDAWLIPGAIAHHHNATALLIATFGHLLGMFGPAIAAVILWKRFFNERIPNLKWSRLRNYLYTALVMEGLWVVPAIAGLLFGNTFHLIPKVSTPYWIFVITILSVGWFAGIGEELGWSGFLLTRLSPFIGNTKAVIISGIFRGIWHLPILVGPILYKTVTGAESPYLLGVMGIVYLFQLVISNVLFGSVFGYLWYTTKSYPLLGWTHFWFDMARDFSFIFILGYQSSFWPKFGWGLVFYVAAYILLDKIARAEGITNLNKIFFSNWKNFLSPEKSATQPDDLSE